MISGETKLIRSNSLNIRNEMWRESPNTASVHSFLYKDQVNLGQHQACSRYFKVEPQSMLWICLCLCNVFLPTSSVIRQKGESQNGCFKKAKHAKISEKQTFLTS